MAKRVYLNRRTGRGREFLGCAVVVGLMVVLALLALFFFAGTWGLFDDWLARENADGSDGGEREELTGIVDGGVSSQSHVPYVHEGEDVSATPYTIGSAAAGRLWQEVRNSPHVKQNALYDAIAENIIFRYAPTVNEVNAFAAVRHMESAQSMTPVVYLLGGAVRFSRLIAMAVVSDPGGSDQILPRMIANLPDDVYSQLSESTASLIAKTNGLDRVLSTPEQANQVALISSGVLLGILAHEAGHQLLGHCHRGNRCNVEITRNQEREADSFASSVISASPYGRDVLVGQLLWFRALAMQEQGEASDARKEEMKRTHPYSKERYENFIRANPQKAQELGLTVK